MTPHWTEPAFWDHEWLYRTRNVLLVLAGVAATWLGPMWGLGWNELWAMTAAWALIPIFGSIFGILGLAFAVLDPSW